MADPEDKISDALGAPRKVMIDGNLVEMPDLDNQVKAAEYIDRKNAQTGGSKLGILRFRIRPGSSL